MLELCTNSLALYSEIDRYVKSFESDRYIATSDFEIGDVYSVYDAE